MLSSKHYPGKKVRERYHCHHATIRFTWLKWIFMIDNVKGLDCSSILKLPYFFCAFGLGELSCRRTLAIFFPHCGNLTCNLCRDGNYILNLTTFKHSSKRSPVSAEIKLQKLPRLHFPSFFRDYLVFSLIPDWHPVEVVINRPSPR